ncbi:MAG TPA: TetR/AcrR family transcriptional regulator [Paenalcaligenes sp.]|nr:TetR/AcrR family transcriptional regulator [Paenalcaligenes sp.]
MSTKTSRLFDFGGDKQQQVLQTALSLFSQKGFFNTSVHEVVARAGVSVGFIYHHFKDKQGIARALYDYLLQRMNALLDDIELQHSSAQARCRAVIYMLFELTEAEPETMSFIIHARHQEFLPQEKPICSASAFVRMRHFVSDGLQAGELTPMDSALASALMYGAAIRLLCLRLDGVVEDSLFYYFEPLWAQVWSQLKAN